MKTGYVAIIGEPNVGKSTLLNRLLGTKLSIVSEKPQTTRNRVLGILTEAEYQCCFIDTPGILRPAFELQKMMVEEVKIAVQNADVVVWMTGLWAKPANFPKGLVKPVADHPVIAVINKIDIFPKTDLLPFIDRLKEFGFRDIVPVSALTGDGVDRLKRAILECLPEGPFLYPNEDISDRPEKFFVAEIIRERIFRTFKKEIPYATCVAIEEFKEREKGKFFIRAVIYVERDSQKAILIGKKGQSLKQLGKAVRPEIERFIDHELYLELWVKVREKWQKDKKFLKEIGY
jgi:GTP-binding protein Era